MICAWQMTHRLIYVKNALRVLHGQGMLLRNCHKSMRLIRTCLLAGTLVAPGGASACLSDAPQHADVRAVHETGDIVLGDGRILSLAGILWPSLADAASRRRLQRELATELHGGRIAFEPVGGRDRWSRQPAYVASRESTEAGDGLLQSAVLAAGLAYHWPSGPAGPCVGRLLAAEQQAREARLGLWSSLHQRKTRWRLRSDETAPISLSIVLTARVRSVRPGRSVMFVNVVGPRGKTPGLSMSNKVADAMRRTGWNETQWIGQRIIARAIVVDPSGRRLVIPSPAHVQVVETSRTP